jgi:hypothetical protein
MRLLLYLTCSHREPQFPGPIDNLLNQSIDWQFLIEAALSHRVFPLFYRNLRLHKWNGLSGKLQKSLQGLFLSIAAGNLRTTKELIRIVNLAGEQGIALWPFKGPMLAASAYGDVALRQFGDLDILVRPEDATRAKEILCAEGYVDAYGLTLELEKTLMTYQKHFVLISSAKNVIVELHWTVEPVTICKRFCEDIWNRPSLVFLDGEKMVGLSAEDTLVLLCLHGTSHCWDRLGWICDVAEHTARTPSLKWNFAVEQARDLGCLRMFFLGLALAHKLVVAPVPEDIVETARGYSGVASLSNRVVRQLTLGPLKSSSTLLFRLAARESTRDKFRLLMERFFIPDALDCKYWRLPRKLSFLYFVLRPVRLLMQTFMKK